ncbi:ribonuclease domain-containing protein [Microbacterium sp. LWH10-1.2]|uniref:ribonuclease domain-containing protein n=1 Tax=Microbacterium sp. LWH10-1.2 TaxID=3135255 RepID=UPI003139D305
MKSPATRSRSLLSAVHRAGITDKCSVFEPICIRPGGRDTVYCSDLTLGTIAQATCTMDYRPTTLLSKAIDILLAGIPVGWIFTRGLRLLLEAKAAAAATKTAVSAGTKVDNAVSTIPSESAEVIRSIQSSGVISQSGVKGPAVPKPFVNDGRGGGQVLPLVDDAGNSIIYREWGTVPNAENLKPGGERIVTGSDGSVYYSPDHYQTFVRWSE